jgi:hypothetical protein
VIFMPNSTPKVSPQPRTRSDVIVSLVRPDGTPCRAKLIGGNAACAECQMADGGACPHAFSFGRSFFCRLAAIQRREYRRPAKASFEGPNPTVS